MADECDFLELLIASERVEAWIDTIKDTNNTSRRALAIRELAAAVESKEAYAEEARIAGAVPALTRLLKSTEDEELLDLISDIIAACSGPAATSAKVRQMRTFEYNGVPVLIKEGALGDGVGAKVWTVAHTLCRELATYPEIVRGKEVLEIGSGCGACGILAAKVGATQVFLTDYLDSVLDNLRTCVNLNGQEGTDGCGTGQHTSEVAEMSDPEDASDCSDFDALLGELAATSPQTNNTIPWDKDNMHVRFLDWNDSLTFLRNHASAASNRAASCESSDEQQNIQSEAGTAAMSKHSSNTRKPAVAPFVDSKAAPRIEERQRFPVIIGTDILYEWPMAEMVASVLRHRLLPGGQALLCCAVREQAMFDDFFELLYNMGFRVGVTSVHPKMDDGGILGNDRDYEGGFVLIAVEYAEFPASWHRDDLFHT